MARVIPPDRLAQLVDAATAVFIEVGYRRAQMADVAERLGVGKGTLYGYVESKEALFDAAVRYADGDAPLPDSSALPLRTPEPGATIRFVRERLTAEVRELALVATLARKDVPDDPRTELTRVIRDLFRRMARHRRSLKLLDRCAPDYPELAAVWFHEGRWGHVDLLREYLERRIADGSFRAVPNVAITARMILETIALWAMHAHWDPSPRPFEEADVENAVVDMLVHALAKESPS